MDGGLLHRIALVGAVLLAGGLVVVLVRMENRSAVGERLRRRFILGVPWGTLAVSAFVFAVYAFVQGGLEHWYNPVVIPFRAWTYFAPLGIATAAFSHTGPGHLIGNLVGTLALAPIAEYAWGHFPRRRGASSFGSLRDHPYVRAFVVFPAAAAAVGLFTAAFSIGPIIGFSGVVFAFAGAALVVRPLLTVVALTAASGLRLAYLAVQNPVTVASGRPAYITPWWADIAIQGHAIGLLAGITLSAVLAARRGDDLPGPGRLFAGTLLFGIAQSLWAVYWFRGGGTFVLYRAAGLALVALLATLVAGLGVERMPFRRESDSDASFGVTLSRADGGRSPGDGEADRSVSDKDAGPGSASTTAESLRDLTPRQVALVALVLGTALLSGPAIPVNLTTVSDDSLPGDSVEVRGYQVTYAENIENGMVSAIDVSAFGETTRVNTSGVIVRNPERGVWTTAVSKGRLAFAGRVQVVVGGIGWRETVLAVRDGWSAVGGGTTYRIRLRYGGEGRTAFVSNAARAEPVIAGRNVSVAASPETFTLRVEHNGTTATAPIPAANETVTIAGIRFVRSDDAILAVANGTRVTVARKEQYRNV